MMQDDSDEAFIADLEHLFGARVRADDEFASTLYCAITQVVWTHVSKGESGFTYRGAEAVLDQIGRRDMGLLIEPGSGHVSEEIASALQQLGWRYRSLVA